MSGRHERLGDGFAATGAPARRQCHDLRLPDVTEVLVSVAVTAVPRLPEGMGGPRPGRATQRRVRAAVRRRRVTPVGPLPETSG